MNATRHPASYLARQVAGLLAAATFLAAGSAEADGKAPASRTPEPRLFGVSAGFKQAFLPRSLSGSALAVGAEIRPVPVVSLALSGALFSPVDGGFDTGPAAPLRTQTLGSVGVDMKGFVIATSERFAELYLLGGIGMIGTRPVSVRDPANRSFDWAARVDFSVGLGGRLNFSSHVAAFIETRATAFLDQRENVMVAVANPRDRSTWLGEKPLVTMVDLQAGLVVSFGP